MAGKTENLVAALGNPAALKRHAAAYFKEADANGDGLISHDEAVNIIRAISFRHDFPMPSEDKVMALVRKWCVRSQRQLSPTTLDHHSTTTRGPRTSYAQPMPPPS